MGRKKEYPKKHIVSCRINSEEMDILREISEDSGMSITMLLRKSLDALTQNNTVNA
ncbi:MAG: hydrogen-dependent growth transcriptional repressor [Desulfuromonas sp.]|nr:MAG: hydrogen-dependent growth transcriptional repressor [Desulfuromonas sp.]